MTATHQPSDTMDQLRETNDGRALLRAAVEWVDRLHAGRVTPEEAEALRRWRRQEPSHEQAFVEAVRLWRNVGQAVRELGEEAPAQIVHHRFAPSRASAIGRRAFLGGAMAASAAGYLIARPPFGLWPSAGEIAAELGADYKTGTGEQKRINPTQGVSVELNTQTAVSDRSSAQGGRIDLISGEAAITAMGAAKPFTVDAAQGRAIATRASFDVRHLGGKVCVTCVSGDVRVEHGQTAISLSSGRQITYGERGLGPVVTIDPAIVTAWRGRMLIFHDRPLSEVIAEVNRYRPGKIILTNDRLGRQPVYGIFQIDRIDVVIDQVQRLTGARATSLPAGVVLLS
jgi:transmembrane sensor